MNFMFFKILIAVFQN